jgi:hypothetical protein
LRRETPDHTLAWRCAKSEHGGQHEIPAGVKTHRPKEPPDPTDRRAHGQAKYQHGQKSHPIPAWDENMHRREGEAGEDSRTPETETARQKLKQPAAKDALLHGRHDYKV